MANPQKINRSQMRRNARVKAMQALYQQDMAGGEIGDILAQFRETQELDRVDIGYFEELFRGVLGELDALDAELGPLLDRPLAELDAVERSILRIAGFELKSRLDIPYKVVINEAIELAKKFGAEQSHKYINGVVDKLAQACRRLELTAAERS
ncbi:MAG: transcription antitermination factor NusB [Gammaproteobacteria bacterium]|nr:transcription antitermination factor NusB [Gammaproteobacteria bacterium]